MFQTRPHSKPVDSLTDSPRPVVVAALIIFVVGFYARSAQNGFIYDDLEIILEHQPKTTLGEFAHIFAERHFPGLPYYRPLTRTTLLLQKTLHGDNAAMFHFANALLMGLTLWLAYRLLRQPVFRIHPKVALFGALLFAVHPSASSCVYPICSGRETLLPSMWTLATLLPFMHGGRKWYLISLLCLTGALLSKEQAFVLPGILLLSDLLKLSNWNGNTLVQWAWRYVPIGLILMAYLVVRWSLFGGSEFEIALLQNPSGPAWSFLYAIQTQFVPFGDLAYEPPIDVWFSVQRASIAIGCLMLIVTGILRWKETFQKPSLFWLGWFVLTLLPTANVIHQEAEFAERYVFLATLAPIAVAGMISSAVRLHRSLDFLIFTAGAVALVSSAVISWHRCEYYRDEMTFHQQWVETNPNSLDAHVNLGLALHHHGYVAQAMEQFREALRIDPNYAGAHINLGNALLATGQLEEAMSHYDNVIQNAGAEEHFAGAYFNKGLVLETQGDISAAIEHYEKAVELDSEAPEIHLRLAKLCLLSQNTQSAEQHIRRALELVPRNSRLSQDLQNLLDTTERQSQSKVD